MRFQPAEEGEFSTGADNVDFERRSLRVRGNYSHGTIVTPKSGKVRAVPMAAEVSRALARLGQRSSFDQTDDLVFVSETGEHLDGSALRRRFKKAVRRAGLRDLRFHDLRHTFGSLAIDRASIVQVQAWMGHAAAHTTMRYLHHKSQANEADLLGEAFCVGPGAPANDVGGSQLGREDSRQVASDRVRSYS